MQCALSGVVPTEPVLSLKSGHVFEKRLIHKHVEQLGTDPVTNQEMSLNDLVEVKTAKIVRPRPPSATSVPGILQIFQNEWDALMLETHTLKQQLHAARQELTQSLYRNDAANRVIARLIQERDQARAALAAHGMPTGASADGAAPMDSEMGAEVAAGSGIPESAVNKMTEAANALSKPRKKRVKTLVEEVTAAEKVQGFKMGHSHPLHSTSKPGIFSLDLHSQREHLSVTGGADGNAIVFNLSSGKIEDTLKAHTARVNDVKFHPTAEVVFTASADNSAIVWGRSEGKYGPLHTLQHHTGEVVGLSVHPCGDYFVTASADSSWNFYDTASGVLFKSVSDEKQSGYTSVSFHPDGLILGCGTKDGFVRIFDVKSQSVAASFSEGHSGAIRSLAFSENGYYFASADDSGQIKLWDLRKLANFKTLSGAASAAVASLAFDESGSYLAAGSSDIRVFETKNWDILSTLGDHKAEVTALKFTKKAAGLVSVSKDRNLKVYSA